MDNKERYITKPISYPDFVDTGNITEYTDENNVYRYSLTIPFKDALNPQKLVVIMKNPSCASHIGCDRTIHRVCRVTQANEYGGVIILNLFPVRATIAADVRSFYESADYETNMAVNLSEVTDLCAGMNVVFAWGTNTIGGGKKYYDEAVNKTISAVKAVCADTYYVKRCKCARNVCTAGSCNCPADIRYPSHGLCWKLDSKFIKY